MRRTDLLRPNVEDHRPPTQTDRPVTPGAAAEDPNDFLLRCFVHFLADFYVTSVLAPRVPCPRCVGRAKSAVWFSNTTPSSTNRRGGEWSAVLVRTTERMTGHYYIRSPNTMHLLTKNHVVDPLD